MKRTEHDTENDQGDLNENQVNADGASALLVQRNNSALESCEGSKLQCLRRKSTVLHRWYRNERPGSLASRQFPNNLRFQMKHTEHAEREQKKECPKPAIPEHTLSLRNLETENDETLTCFPT